MSDAQLSRQIQALRSRTAALQQRATEFTSPQQELLAEALEELRSTAEDLRVAEEELREQKEALVVAQVDLERRLVERTEQLEAAIRLKDGLLAREQAALAATAEATEQLRLTDQRFQIAITRSPVTIFHQDRELRYTWLCNPTFGFSVDESLGKLDADLLPAEGAARLTALKRRVLELGTSARDEVPLTVDGKTRHYDLAIDPLRDQSDTIVGITGAAIDITERKRAEEALRFLDQTSSILASSLDFEATLENLGRMVVSRLGDWCAIDVLEEDGTIRRVVSTHADPARDDLLRQIRRRYSVPPGGQHPVARVLRIGSAISLADISDSMLTAIAEDEEHLQLLRRLETRSLVVVPLASRGRVLGTIMVGSDVPNRYDAEDLMVAKLLGRRAAVAIDNAYLYAAERQARRAAERAAERSARLQAVPAALAAAMSPAQVASVIIEHGTAALGARAGFFALLSDDGATLEILASTGYAPEKSERFRRIPAGAPVPVADAVRSGELIVLESPEARNARYPYLATTETSNQAFAAIPLVAEGGAIGGIGLSFAEPRTFDEEDRIYLENLGKQCALAVQRTRHYEAERSARAKAEAAEERYRSLLEGVQDGVVIIDAEGRYVDCNSAALELLGYTREAFLQLGVGDLAVDRQGATEDFATTRRMRSRRGELEVRRKDGSVVPIEACVTAIDLPGGEVYLSAWRDISERRVLERLQHEFLAMVSHELKNPLTAVKGYAQLMRRSGEYSEQSIDAIVAQTNRLARLVDELLDVAQLEAGRLELRRVAVDLAALVAKISAQAQTLSSTHTIRAEIPVGAVTGRWDPDRLEQVLENLISNALKYAPGGEVVLRVERSGDQARVSITDEGVGIPPAELARVFDRFYRSVDVASTTPGLGLGLYISRSLVEAHGGRIWAEPAGDQGTRFAFELPCES